MRSIYLRDGSLLTILTCWDAEMEVPDQAFYLTQSQHIDTGPTSPNFDLLWPLALLDLGLLGAIPGFFALRKYA